MKVFYDGLCPLCSREINHYRGAQGSDQICFVDITSHEFRPEEEGLDSAAVHRVIHVKRDDGTTVTGVDAFREIWNTLPAYKWLGKVVGLSPIRFLMGLGYSLFVKVRPLFRT
ncbi:DUF393 domain-containing protein [bacterium]|nr:DUF393 domain-containing protein [bacterium]